MRLLRTLSVAGALVLCAHPALAEPLKLRIADDLKRGAQR